MRISLGLGQDKDLEKKKEAAAGPRAKLAAEKGKKREKNKKEKKMAERWEEIFGGSWRKRKGERREKGKKKKEERIGRKLRRKSRNFSSWKKGRKRKGKNFRGQQLE